MATGPGTILERLPARLALDTSCVVNLLTPAEDVDGDLLRIIRLGTEARTRLIVTPLVDIEVPGGDVGTPGDGEPSFVRSRLAMFAEEPVSEERRRERDELGRRYHELLWPNANPESNGWEHQRRDCLHLASLKLLGGGVFVTLDERLRKKARRSNEELGCLVCSPAEVVASIPASPRHSKDRYGAVVRRAKTDDGDAVARLMDPIRSSYPNFDAWKTKALGEKNAFIGVFDGEVAGISVWSAKDDRVVKLSTFYVGDDHQGRGLGPHLLFHQLRLWVTEGYEKVYVTVSSERLHALEFFLQYGFRIEGASMRRYKAGSTEFVLAKHLFYEEIDDDGLVPFLDRLSREVFELPDHARVRSARSWFMPPRQRSFEPVRDTELSVRGVAVVEDGQTVDTLGLNELEELVYPARLSLGERTAFIIPIQPSWADALMEIPRAQGSLFPNADKLRLRTDNAYFCAPRFGPERLNGSPVLFYVSQTDKAVAGFARILECRVAPPDDLFAEFGDIGILGLNAIREHARSPGDGRYAGKAMALRFAWWVPFERPVGLDELRSEFAMSHPQTITSVPYTTYGQILKKGGIAW